MPNAADFTCGSLDLSLLVGTLPSSLLQMSTGVVFKPERLDMWGIPCYVSFPINSCMIII